MTNPFRVMIADDPPHAREAISVMLEDHPKFSIVAQAKNGIEAIELSQLHSPDIILMDIEMPKMNGLEATKIIKEKSPYMKVIMLSVSDDVADLFTAVQYGAQGYLLKNMDPDDWLEYLLSVVEGSSEKTRGIANKLLYQFRENDLQNSALEKSLTPREREILLLIAKGITNKQIAEQLFISENTVKNHIKNLLEKLEVENRVQLAAYAFKHYKA
ncbi:response regulator transcription factor [Robertmurraya yapensis]|uniref:Response regulator transcription factor n=1 Tax=Bacillus yapensis TaxID=2492960 RepID=A0A3S0IQF4_9BACI|nr:response regulator transcription factor [Bacillus yapensis]RTR29156.1 response regulator transcription factor [Bacillus yapensis]TKS94761.1 response regulator [Bacillus yapensis]